MIGHGMMWHDIGKILLWLHMIHVLTGLTIDLSCGLT